MGRVPARNDGVQRPQDSEEDELSCSSLWWSFHAYVRERTAHGWQNCSRNRVLFFLRRHMPILEWLPTYDMREDLQYDLVAGITVGMMIVPQEISLSTMMGVPPIYGLYTAAVVPMIYPLFGTSRVLSVANGAEVSLLVGSAIKKIESEEERVATGILLSFLVSVFMLMMGIFRLGVLADFFSRPVMGGFVSAGGVLIMLSQCANWFGVKIPNRDLPFLTVLDLIAQSPHINTTSFLLGAVSIGVLIGMRSLKRNVVLEMSKLEDELEDAFMLETSRAMSRMSGQSEFMDDEFSEASGVEHDDHDHTESGDDANDGYDDIELGTVGARSHTPGRVKRLDLDDEEQSGGVRARKLASPGWRTPQLASSGTSKVHRLPALYSTGSLRRSELSGTSPWNGRRLESPRDLDGRSCRQSDINAITRNSRMRTSTANVIMDEGVGFSLSDEDYLTLEQPLEFSFMARRAVVSDDAVRRPPNLMRSISENSWVTSPHRPPVLQLRSTPSGGENTLSDDKLDPLTSPESTLRARSISPEKSSSPKQSTSPRQQKKEAQQDEESADASDGNNEQSARPTRMKHMASPAKSVVSDVDSLTDSTCSTTALNRGALQIASSSTSIRTLRSKIAVLIALRLVCDLGAFMVCLFGGIVGYLLGEKRLALTGDVPGGYPMPKLPWYGLLNGAIEADRLYHIIIDTLSIAIISYMASVAMAKRLAIKEGYRIRPNQELIALGLCNLVGSFFQSMPATGGLSRTAVNMQNARTQLASLITVGVVVMALYTATSALAYLPKASLSAMIIVAGYMLIETKEAKWLYRVKREEFYVWLASFFLTVLLGVLPGLLSSIFCSLIAVIYKTRRPTVTMLGEITDEATGEREIVDLDLYPDTAKPLSDIVVIRVEGALYFANCEYIERVIEREISLRHQTEDVAVHGVVIDAGSIMDWDSTTIQMMKYLIEDLGTRNIQLAFVNARDRLQNLLSSTELLEGVVRRSAKISFHEAIDAIREHARLETN